MGGTDVKKREAGRGSDWKDYIPLLVVILLSAGAAAAMQASPGHDWQMMAWMHGFMGIFLVMFAMFKLFDIEGFADGFQMYDLLAKRTRAYACVYPFIELGLGYGYLAHWWPIAAYSVTVIVMVFGAAGVLVALKKGLDLECACMGSILSVPLSTVALVEDLGMAVMAGGMILTRAL